MRLIGDGEPLAALVDAAQAFFAALGVPVPSAASPRKPHGWSQRCRANTAAVQSVEVRLQR